jgi:hypothetical protein
MRCGRELMDTGGELLNARADTPTSARRLEMLNKLGEEIAQKRDEGMPQIG